VKTSSLALVCAGLCALSIALAAPAQAQTRYQLTDLGTLAGYANSRAYDINNQGQIVGQVAEITTANPGIEAKAILWDGAKVTLIETPDGLPLGVAQGINESGQIVGGSGVENYGSHGFDFAGLSSRAFTFVPGKKQDLAATQSRAYAINKGGQIVGQLDTNATLWNNGVPLKLAVSPEVLQSTATAINEKGTVAGIVTLGGGKRQAALWSDGKIQILGTLPGDDQSIANAINDKGQIVGSSGEKGSYWNQPFLWENGKMEMLMPLDGRTWINQVMDINQGGQIVGCGMKDGVYMHAVAWEKQDDLELPGDLNDLTDDLAGLTLMRANAINDQGQIVGEARNSKGEIHAFLLTPLAPAPAK